MGANAQAWQKTKDFLGSNKYEILVGYNTNVANEPFTDAKIGYNFGVTARREFASYKDAIGAYGLVGVVLTKRGGKTDSDLMTLGDDGRNLNVFAVSVPIHAGAECRWKKLSLFADLGPNVLFKTGAGEMDNLSTNAVAIGGGFDLGLRISKFAISFGFDQDFTNIGTFKPDYDQRRDYGFKESSYDLKTSEFHFDLRWTF